VITSLKSNKEPDELVSWLQARMMAQGYEDDQCSVRLTHARRIRKNENGEGETYYVRVISIHPDDGPRVFLEYEPLTNAGTRVRGENNGLAGKLMAMLKRQARPAEEGEVNVRLPKKGGKVRTRWENTWKAIQEKVHRGDSASDIREYLQAHKNSLLVETPTLEKIIKAGRAHKLD